MNKKKIKEPKINVIEEYFKDTGAHTLKKNELFDAGDDIDIKTDLTHEQITLINTLHENDLFLAEKGLKPVFNSYYEKHMRLLISKERKSRGEFVDVERGRKEREMNDLPQPMQVINK